MSKQFDDAVIFATNAHSGQVRKSAKIPYILHPLEVASIIATITSDEDILIAGLLHDTVEDTNVTIEEIQERFGERVAELVAHETEDKRADLPPASTWQIRKEETLLALKEEPDIAVKILWLGDKLSNIRSIYLKYTQVGDEVFSIFHQKDKSKHAWYYRSVAEYVSELKDTVAYKEYVSLLDKIFD